MKRKIAVAAGTLAFLIPAAVAGSYTGPECSGTLPSGWSHTCAYHTHVRRVYVWSRGLHWVWWDGRNSGCVRGWADTGYGRFANGRATVGNCGSGWMSFHGNAQ